MNGALVNKHILITYGPTWVAIDDIRVISNRSSGEMGRQIIDDLIKAGSKVTVLEGPVSEPLKKTCAIVKKFTFYDELSKLLRKELKQKYDIIIHAAAVSDLKPKKTIRGKISSDRPLQLTLEPTKKLIAIIKRCSPKSVLVGFKLASVSCQRKLKEEAVKLIQHNQCDLVVANSLKKGYTGFIFNQNGTLLEHGKSRKTISRKLIKQLLDLYPCLPAGKQT